MLNKVFEWLFAAILILALLPCIVSIVVHTLGPVLLVIVIVGAVAVAYRMRERHRPRSQKPRGGAGAERTPVFPRGED